MVNSCYLQAGKKTISFGQKQSPKKKNLKKILMESDSRQVSLWLAGRCCRHVQDIHEESHISKSFGHNRDQRPMA